MKWTLCALAALAAIVACSGGLQAQQGIVFEDVTGPSGLGQYLKNWTYGHAGAWGDVNGDGRPDLLIGAFGDHKPYQAPNPPIPNQLFLSTPAGFVLSPDKAVRLEGVGAATTASIFADLNNDGKLDLVLSNLRIVTRTDTPAAAATSPADPPAKDGKGQDAKGRKGKGEAKQPREGRGDRNAGMSHIVFENLGNGQFRDVTDRSSPWPGPASGRNVAACDFNGDGLLDLVFCDGSYGNWGSGRGRLVVLENQGNFVFKDASAKYGMPDGDAAGMGLAVGDVNDDGKGDFFVADCDRMFVSGPDGKYRECQAGTFLKPNSGDRESHTCGAAFGDLNGDGLLDLVTTEHGTPSRIRVYLNTGVQDGMPVFKDVSEQVGLGMTVPGEGKTGLPVKGAHVQIFDLDNDGRQDILVAMIWQDAAGKIQPFVCRNEGSSQPGGMPHFSVPPLANLIGYFAPAPMADYDRDGRVDIFLPTWGQFRRNNEGSELDIPSYLLRNVSPSGHWLTVKVAGSGKGFNPMGIGATVRAYKAGQAGDKAALIVRRDIVVGSGYSSGEEALAHLGLGAAAACDLEISWAGKKKVLPNVPANQLLTVPFDGQ